MLLQARAKVPIATYIYQIVPYIVKGCNTVEKIFDAYFLFYSLFVYIIIYVPFSCKESMQIYLHDNGRQSLIPPPQHRRRINIPRSVLRLHSQILPNSLVKLRRVLSQPQV